MKNNIIADWKFPPLYSHNYYNSIKEKKKILYNH